jgi:alcohol dehydrogenase
VKLPVGNWNYPTRVRFGAGRIRELPAACRELGVTRPLLVTDPGLAGLPLFSDACAMLQAAGLQVEVFSALKANPVGANLAAALDPLCQ